MKLRHALIALAAVVTACAAPPPPPPPMAPVTSPAPPAPGGKVFLGVVPAQVTPALAKEVGLPEPRGLYVFDVREGGAAIRNGIGKGDILLSLAGKPLVVNEDLGAAIAGRVTGETVSATIWRDGREITRNIQL